jgi:hypothetical protein
MAGNSIEYKQLMNTTKTRKKPKSKQNLRHAKKRLARTLKIIQKKSRIPKIVPECDDEPDFLKEIKRTLAEQKTYNPNNEVHAYASTLQKTEWMGLLTLKLHSRAYSKDDFHGLGRKNRFDFLDLFMENLRNRKFRIKESEFKWVACEEFGISGDGHVHVLFSFDYLKSKGREDKIPKIDFSEEKGQFFREALESANFFWRKLNKNHSTVDIHWRPMWENEGLVNYFCKLEDGRPDKEFKSSKCVEIHENWKDA